MGANVGRDNGQAVATKDIQHCNSIPSQAKPELWDVTCNFRGQEQHMQITAPPGSTITINAQGEPREYEYH